MKFVILALFVAISLAGCGRRGAPSPPGPAAAVTYPQSYPSE